MKITFPLATLVAVLTSTMLGNRDAQAVVTTVTGTNGYTMQVALVSTEPPQAPMRNQFNQNVMNWLTGPRHAHTGGYWRSDPSAILPDEMMYRPWYLIFSTQQSFNLWNCMPNPTGQYTNEMGTMLQAPLIIGTTNADMTFNPTNLWYAWSSSDYYHAFSGVRGRVAILSGANTLQDWSTTCVGMWGTNLYMSGPMTNRVNQIAYYGVSIGFGVTNASNNPYGSAYASNYVVGQWPFDITITYTLMDDSGSNILCQGSAALDPLARLHIGNTGTNTSFVGVACATLEAQDYMRYQINTYTNGLLNPSRVWGAMKDNDIIPVGTNTDQYFTIVTNKVNQGAFTSYPRTVIPAGSFGGKVPPISFGQ